MSSVHRDCSFRPRSLAGLMAAIALLCPALSRPVPASSSSAATEPVFTGLLVDGRAVSGRITAISADRITLASEESAREEVPLRSLVKLAREPRPPAPALEGSHVLLPEGDRLMRVIVGATTETAIEVQSQSALGKLTLPLECVLGLVLTAPPESDAFDQLWERVTAEPRTTEVVWMANGDRLTGGFLGLDDRAIKLQIDGKPVEVDRTGVIAVGFDPAVVSYPRPASGFIDLTLADGSRLGVTDARVEKGQVVATTRFGQPIRLPIGDLIRLDPRTDAVVYLSERNVDAKDYSGYFGATRPFRVDRTVDGHGFQLGGHAYDRGLGAASRTLLAYKLKPGDRRFQALVGVDDRAGPLGSVVFRVLTDRVPRVTTPALTSRDAPQAIDIDVSEAKLLILITEFGERGDVRDLADWVEARIIR
jgi:NPCBM/NEW2 domain